MLSYANERLAVISLWMDKHESGIDFWSVSCCTIDAHTHTKSHCGHEIYMYPNKTCNKSRPQSGFFCSVHPVPSQQSDKRRQNNSHRWKWSSHVLFIVIQMRGFMPEFRFAEQMFHMLTWDESSLDQLSAYSLLMIRPVWSKTGTVFVSRNRSRKENIRWDQRDEKTMSVD